MFSIVYADVNLDQCTINNNNPICSQTIEKIIEQEADIIVEEKKEVTIEDLLYQVIERIMNSREKSDVTITASFESDTYDSVLVENQNEMKCINDICAKEKEWR